MGGMKTFLVICFGLLASPALAFGTADQQLRTFAACAGKLSAKMEWQWMFDGAASEQTKQHRAAMIGLLDASMAQGQGREVLKWRVDAKVAHSALLTRASFGNDPDDASWALELAQAQEAQCTALLLG